MIATTVAMFIVLAIGCLIIDFSAFHQAAHQLRFGTKALMAVAWALIIIGLALVLSRIGA
jgi:hypothetical protein